MKSYLKYPKTPASFLKYFKMGALTSITSELNSAQKDLLQTLEEKLTVIFTPKVIPANLLGAVAATIKAAQDVNPGSFFQNAIGVIQSIEGEVRTKINRDNFENALTPYKVISNQDNKTTTLSIGLPLKPSFLNISHSQAWAMNEDMLTSKHTAIMEAILSVGDTVMSVVNQAGNTVSDFSQKASVYGPTKDKANWNETLNKAKSMVTKGAGAAVGAMVTEIISKTSPVIAQLGGYVYSPQRSVYGGGSPKSFSFDWEFIPFDEDEAREIKSIIEIFQYLSYAQGGNKAGGNSVQSVYQSPPLWEVQFPKSKDENDGFPILSRDNKFICVLNGVNMNYGEGDFYTSFKNGFPNIIKMNLSFTEYFPPRNADDVFGQDTTVDEILQAVKKRNKATMQSTTDQNQQNPRSFKRG